MSRRGHEISAITSPDTPDHVLVRVIGTIAVDDVPASFWTAVANDSRFSSLHRLHCIRRVFEAYVPQGATLAALAEILRRPAWLRDEDVTLVTFIAGEIPVQWNSQDTIVRMLPFGLSGGQVDLAIYLRISGRLSAREVVTALRGGATDPRILDARILEVGLFRPAPDREP